MTLIVYIMDELKCIAVIMSTFIDTHISTFNYKIILTLFIFLGIIKSLTFFKPMPPGPF
jgi:hypothetical protein